MKIFTKQTTIRNFTGSLGVVFLLSQISCRTSDAENNLAGGPAAVKINLLGTEFANSKGIKPAASVAKQGLDLGNSGVQSKSIMVNPSTFIIARLAPVNESLSAQASVKPNLSAAVPGAPLGSGIKFRVIAYDQGSGQYKTHQDYTVGQAAAPLMLDGGTAYNMVVYSYGSTTLPAISSGETTDLNSAVVNYDDNNRDFMYQNLSYTPVNAQNTLDITLRHKVAQITTSIISNLPGNGITSITNAAITPHATNATIPLASGNITGRTNVASAAIDFSFLSTESTSITAAPIFVNADTGGNNTASFSASAIVGGNPRTINLPNAFSITPGDRQNFTVNFTHCGAYIAPGVWKDFMCHNLGADLSADPFALTISTHGAKYQWGAKTGETGVYLSQTDDINTGTASTSQWFRTPLAGPTHLPNDSWSDSNKTDRDPCPEGYRVPTGEQLRGLMLNNVITQVGNWASTTSGNNPTNFISGIQVSNNGNVTLFLPTAGSRGITTGQTRDRGFGGNYWTSTLSALSVNAINLFFGNQTTSDNFIDTTGPNPINRGSNRGYGFSIRCIKE